MNAKLTARTNLRILIVPLLSVTPDRDELSRRDRRLLWCACGNGSLAIIDTPKRYADGLTDFVVISIRLHLNAKSCSLVFENDRNGVDDPNFRVRLAV